MKTTVKKFKGDRLKLLIQKRGISQEMFAESFGVSTQTVSYWISGKKKPTAYNLELLADYFDVPQSSLTGDFILCSNSEYKEISDRFRQLLPNTVLPPIDETIKPMLDYFQLIGKRYSSFDFDILDKCVIGDTVVFHIIKSIVDKTIEDCFIEFGIISEDERIEKNDTE